MKINQILKKMLRLRQIFDTGTSKYPISYKLRKNSDGWKIVNIIINGLNLGLNMRNQFQALAKSQMKILKPLLKIGIPILEMLVFLNMKEKIEQILIENIPDAVMRILWRFM